MGGCESGWTVPDPSNPDIVWATCYGNEVTRGDAKTRLARSVSPWLHTLSSAPGDAKYRCHWTAPLAVDPFDPKSVYYGCQVIFKTSDAGQSWKVIAYRWFCRLGLDGDVPDHSTFSKTRHGRFRDSDLLRRLFEDTVKRCIAERLVGGDGFAVDASLIRAEANRQRLHDGHEGLPPGVSSRQSWSISRFLMTRPSAQPHRQYRHACRHRTRHLVIPRRTAGRRSSATPPTI